jgi:anti-sigma regulatory factor (Ser/Thr protein kinase)
MDALTCGIESEPAATAVTVIGMLSCDTGPLLHRTLVKCLADCPPALIVDLADLTVARDSALNVFTSVLRYAERWPTVPILLCAPSPAVLAGLTRIGLTLRVPVCASRTDAIRRAAETALPRICVDLPPIRSSSALARELVRSTCQRWRVPDLFGAAELVVSELVSNAILHAGTGLTVVLLLSARHLHIVVRDGSKRPPTLNHSEADRTPEEAALHGRGLLLVDAVASSWGMMLTHDGKAVWAAIGLPPAR